MLLWSLSALAGPPQPLTPDLLPEFPDHDERVRERCVLTWITQEDGQHRVLSLRGCTAPFDEAVRERLWSWTWRTAPPDRPEALDPTWALLTGHAGVPQGLYTAWEITFYRPRPGAEPTVSIVGLPIVTPLDTPKVKLGERCALLLHVDEQGRANRVQARECSEQDRDAVETELMAWTFEPLRVEGEPVRFAVGLTAR